MLPVSSKIWTRVAVSISYDHNHYTKGTSIVKLKNTEASFFDSHCSTIMALSYIS